MKNITLGDILAVITFIVAFIGGVEFIVARLNKLLDKKLEPIRDEIKDVRNEVKDVRVDGLKTDIINYQQLARIGKLRETQRKDYYDKLDKYTSMGLNSYVHQGHEELVKEGKI